MPVTMFMKLLQQQSTKHTTQFTVHLGEPCTLPARSNPPDIRSRVLHMYSHCRMWQPSVAARVHVAHSPHIHDGLSVVRTKYRPCPQLSQKWGVASVKSLTWQHLHWTAVVGRGHNRHERQRQSTQSMVTVGLWRSHWISGMRKSNNWLWNSPLHNATQPNDQQHKV